MHSIHAQVRIPHIDWDCVFQDSPSTYTYSIISKGFDKYYMGQGLTVYMVDNPAHAPEAIARLRESMQVCGDFNSIFHYLSLITLLYKHTC